MQIFCLLCNTRPSVFTQISIFIIAMIPPKTNRRYQRKAVFFTIYYFVISFFGIFGRKRDEKVKTPEKTFAVIVAAHNEEQVIGQLVENLHLLNYPDSLYDIFVVAQL